MPLHDTIITASRARAIALVIINRGPAGADGGLSAAQSETPPADTTQLWFDPSDGSLSFYDTANGVWVVTSGANGTNTEESATSTVSTLSTATGGTITATAEVDETILLDSATASPVALIYLSLPSVANARIGQIKTFISTKTITSLTVSVSGGGTVSGPTLTSASAYESYSFQCVSLEGAGTWLRLS